MTLIVLEGLSGVGKSTLAPLLAPKLSAAFVPSIPSEFAAARRLVDAQRDVTARHMFYVAALVCQLPEIARQVDEHGTVLLESFFDRAQAFHIGMGSEAAIDTARFLRPDIVVLIECEAATRAERLSARGSHTTAYWRQRAEECVEAISDVYARVDAIRVDSTGVSAEELAINVAELVQAHLAATGPTPR